VHDSYADAYSRRTLAVSQAFPMKRAAAALEMQPSRERVSPLLVIGCGAMLMAVAGLIQWMGSTHESALASPSRAAAPISSAPQRQQPSAITVAPSQAELDKANAERVAKARAEQEQQAKQKAALEEARLATRADPASEAKAQSEREQSAQRQAAVDEAHRAATEAEDAWKRFYKPSANCKNPDARATVECVNEYIKAKREFESSRPSGTAVAGR
jgi:hypothetical protein